MTSIRTLILPVVYAIVGMNAVSVQAATECRSHEAPYRVELGINRMNIGRSQSWKEIIDAMIGFNVKSVRMNIKSDGDYYLDAIAYARSQGLQVLLVIPLTDPWFHSDDVDTKRAARKVKAAYGLSTLDENKYRAVLTRLFAKLDSRGVNIADVEIGNEINWSGFNADLPSQDRGMIFSTLQELGAHRNKILEGFKQYRNVLLITRSVLSASQRSAHAKIVSAGLMSTGSLYGLTPWLESSGGTQLSIRLVNEIYDDLGISSLIDKRGIHIYPQEIRKIPVTDQFPELQSVIRESSRLCAPKGEECFVTEWGFNADHDKCWKEDPRDTLYRHTLSAMSCNKEITHAWVFTWDDSPQKAVYHCGQVSSFGGTLHSSAQ